MTELEDATLMQPGFEYCFELRVEVEEAIAIGGAGAGEGPHFAPISGGSFEGPLLQGRIMPGGGDWWNANGLTVKLDARYLIEAELGHGSAVVDVVNRGIWRTTEQAFERMLGGASISETELYYRTAFAFQTAHPELQWLAESQFVGYARAKPGLVIIRVFRLI